MQDSLHIVCPSCNATNRVAGARLAEAPVCGVCKKPLFNGQPLELDSGNFDRHINRSDVPVAVDFWAAWCGPCKMMAPHFARAASDIEPGMRLAKLDTEAAPDIAARYNIRGIPTVIVFHHGQEVARQSGAMETRGLLNWLTPLAESPQSAA